MKRGNIQSYATEIQKNKRLLQITIHQHTRPRMNKFIGNIYFPRQILEETENLKELIPKRRLDQ